MPKISIITPVYCDTSHKVDWLSEMVQSVVNQTLADWEIVFINDQSPLSLDPVKMKYAGDNRLRWFENAENSGPAMTRNTAVALAESECILPLDSDDQLANVEALEYMYDAWLMDQTKTIYGNLQLLTPLTQTSFQRGKVVELASYTFENAMNLGGTMPVTCMHSKECHYQAGGWKAILNQGREDVEYWISAGKHGFCGHKINHTTLLYRKHEQSRDYRLKHITKTLENMQRTIKNMHSDIYSGRFPMACCGKGASASTAPASDPVLISQQNQGEVKIITTLDGYDEKNLEWVAYRGKKQGSSGSILARGPVNTPDEYPILGYGHVFQIHKSHRKLFSDRQTLGFQMNQPDPREQPEPEPIIEVAEIAPQTIEEPKPPEMSTIVRMDAIAAETREADIQEVTERNFEPISDDFMDEDGFREHTEDKILAPIDPKLDRISIGKSQPYSHVISLGLSARLTNTLNDAGYTVEKLAIATPKELFSLPGIGIKRAKSIITKAQELINTT